MASSLENMINSLRHRKGFESGPHPDGDVLQAFADGGLSEEKRTLLGDHLATCPECTDLVLALKGMSVQTLAAGKSSLEATQEAWQRFEESIANEISEHLAQSEPDRGEVLHRAIPKKRPLRQYVFIGIGVVAIFVFGVFLGTSLPRDPRADFSKATLLPQNEQFRGEKDGTRLPVNRPLFLVLPFSEARVYDAYRLECRGRGRIQWTTDRVIQGDGGFNASIEAGTLPEGTYHLILYGREEGTWRKLTTYAFEIGQSP